MNDFSQYLFMKSLSQYKQFNTLNGFKICNCISLGKFANLQKFILGNELLYYVFS